MVAIIIYYSEVPNCSPNSKYKYYSREITFVKIFSHMNCTVAKTPEMLCNYTDQISPMVNVQHNISVMNQKHPRAFMEPMFTVV
jgi:hypothetical protein